MTRRTYSQAPVPGLTQDFKHTHCKSKDMSTMMLKKEWSCNLFEIISWNQFAPFSTSCLNKGKHIVTSKDGIHETTSSVLGKGANPNCSPQWPPIRLMKELLEQRKTHCHTKGWNSWNNLKRAWKGSKPKLLTPMASNKTHEDSEGEGFYI